MADRVVDRGTRVRTKCEKVTVRGPVHAIAPCGRIRVQPEAAMGGDVPDCIPNVRGRNNLRPVRGPRECADEPTVRLPRTLWETGGRVDVHQTGARTQTRTVR